MLATDSKPTAEFTTWWQICSPQTVPGSSAVGYLSLRHLPMGLPRLAAGLLLLGTMASAQTRKFDFGPGPAEPGFTQVLPSATYTPARGFGFDFGTTATGVDRGGADALRGDFVTGANPFFFSVDLPEGNYRVSVTLGDRTTAATATIKSEQRRLMLEKIQTAAGENRTLTFTVNRRSPQINATTSIGLKDREKIPTDYLNWDNKLTFEVTDSRPCLAAMEITRVDDAVTLYLAGNSTVVDQPSEPYGSWGQMFPRFFQDGIVVANYAESGETSSSFIGERRLAKILSTIKAGDYLFFEFGHNDQKDGPATASYKTNLLRFISDAKARQAIPVIVSPTARRSFDSQGRAENTLEDYPAVARQTAQEQGVAFVDLNAMSSRFIEALGPSESPKAFAPGDNTHHNPYGAYELAKCVASALGTARLAIADKVVAEAAAFDPSRPDPVSQFTLPATPLRGPTGIGDGLSGKGRAKACLPAGSRGMPSPAFGPGPHTVEGRRLLRIIP